MPGNPLPPATSPTHPPPTTPSTLLPPSSHPPPTLRPPQIIASQPNLPAADAVEMYVALLSYAGSVHPGQLAYVDEVLAAAHAALGDRGPGLGGDARAERQLVALLSVPLAK